jgi:porphobilinogen synthase
VTRLRRLRRTGALRSLVRETRLDLEDFVMPLFVGPATEPNQALPAMARWSVADVAGEVDALVSAGVRAVILFGIPDEKDEEGSGAWDDDGVIQRALRELRPRFPELVLLTDVCLCEYTSHGHCGVLHGEEVDNDASVELLVRTAVSHVEAGADAVCPSDMMDGRVAALREALPETPIVAYSAKYASAFYGPFREAADSAPAFGDRRGYQMDSANVREARAGRRRGRRRDHGQACAALSRRHPSGARSLRPAPGGVQRLRRVRDGQGGGSLGMAG